MYSFGILALIALAIFVLNVPFGFWRAGFQKFSIGWFAAIHAPVPLVVGLRWAADLPFRWANVPLFVAAYFTGQFIGSRLRRRRGTAVS